MDGQLIWEGVRLGLILSLLVGPILVGIVQAGVEQGFRAGLSVGFGVWISDILFISLVYWGFHLIDPLVHTDSFTFWGAVAGGGVLFGYGIYALLTPPPPFGDKLTLQRNRPFKALWLKGFLINTINPFTIFFWSSIMAGVVVKRQLTPPASLQFFAGVMAVIVSTDALKALLARQIRARIRPIHLFWLRRIVGIAFIIFGLGMLWRAW